jgi:hypothetical protein
MTNEPQAFLNDQDYDRPNMWTQIVRLRNFFMNAVKSEQVKLNDMIAELLEEVRDLREQLQTRKNKKTK